MTSEEKQRETISGPEHFTGPAAPGGTQGPGLQACSSTHSSDLLGFVFCPVPSGNVPAWRTLPRHLLFLHSPLSLCAMVYNNLQGLLLISFRRDLVKCVARVPQNSSCWPQPALGFFRCNICYIYEEKNQNNTTVEKKAKTAIYCSLSVEIECLILTLQKL